MPNYPLTSRASPVTSSEKGSSLSNSPVDSDSAEDEEFREGGYGWIVVAAVLLINAHTWGLNSSYAVFLACYLRSGSIDGSSPLAFAFIGGLSISFAFIVSPLATVCIGKLGTGTTMRIGVVLEAVSFVDASLSTHIWHLVLSQGVCFGAGLGFCFTATVGIVPQWFTKRRSFANAISTSGSGFGGLIYSLATNTMISNLGLAWAFRILAILAFVVNGGCSLVLRDRNKQVGAVHVAFHMGLFKHFEYWLFLGWGFFILIGYVIVVFSLTDYAQVVGFSATQGSLVSAIFNLSQGLGRPVIGLVSDRVGRLNIAGLGTLVAGLAAYFLWIFAGKAYPGLIVYAVFGMFAGVIWPCVAPVGAEVVGLQLLPSGYTTALSIYWLVLVLPATFAEVIALRLKMSEADGYINVQLLAGSMYIASFISVWMLRSWKLQQLEALDVTEAQTEVGTRTPDPAKGLSSRSERDVSISQSPSLLRAYIAGMLTIRRV